jgi:hypothetical protein
VGVYNVGELYLNDRSAQQICITQIVKYKHLAHKEHSDNESIADGKLIGFIKIVHAELSSLEYP